MREWFPLLRISKGFLEEVLKISPKGSAGVNKIQADVGKAFLEEQTAQRNKDQQQHRRRWMNNIGGFVL